MRKFPCSGCGGCCKRVNKLSADYQELKIPIFDKNSIYYFPYKWDETGKCDMLIDNKCSVYNNRPNVCNIEKMRKLLGEPKKQFYKQNIESCNQIMDEDNIPLSFRIKS